MQERKWLYFNISYNYLEWDIIRLLWIAFYKHGMNRMNRMNGYTANHIGELPKDVIKYIIEFMGNIMLDDTNKSHCIVLQ